MRRVDPHPRPAPDPLPPSLEQPQVASTPRPPSFYLIARQPLRPAAILLAIVVALAALAAILFALGRSRRPFSNPDATHSPSASPTSAPGSQDDPDQDDPSQIDTIVLGDPADAPVPARRGNHVSPVHPTILVRLPRFGAQVGLIPDTPAGHLLYAWLAAFNQASSPALGNALPNPALGNAAAAQMQLRQQTGGFNLLSAKEVLPGVLVFRLRDQTPAATEALGTLQMQPDSTPPAIASFSLRAVLPPAQPAPHSNQP